MKTLVMYCQEIVSRRLWTHRDTLSRRCINTRCQDSISRYTYFQHTIVLLSRRYTYIRDDYVVVKTYFEYTYHELSRHLYYILKTVCQDTYENIKIQHTLSRQCITIHFQDTLLVLSRRYLKTLMWLSRHTFSTLTSDCQDACTIFSRRYVKTYFQDDHDVLKTF